MGGEKERGREIRGERDGRGGKKSERREREREEESERERERRGREGRGGEGEKGNRFHLNDGAWKWNIVEVSARGHLQCEVPCTVSEQVQ